SIAPTTCITRCKAARAVPRRCGRRTGLGTGGVGRLPPVLEPAAAGLLARFVARRLRVYIGDAPLPGLGGRLVGAAAAKGDGGSADGARLAMQRQLTRAFFWMVTCASLALIARETVFGGPRTTAAVALLVAGAALAWSYRPTAPLRPLALALFMAMVPLIA